MHMSLAPSANLFSTLSDFPVVNNQKNNRCWVWWTGGRPAVTSARVSSPLYKIQLLPTSLSLHRTHLPPLPQVAAAAAASMPPAAAPVVPVLPKQDLSLVSAASILAAAAAAATDGW